MAQKKGLCILLIVFLSIHFALVLLTQCNQQNWTVFKLKLIDKINEHYINPFLEQNWGMFAPNPPRGSQYIAVQFYTKKDSTEPINIHQKVMENNFKSFFSLDQRILKYFNSCYNDILIKKAENPLNKELLQKSHGLQSILNYSKIVLQKQNLFVTKLTPNDSVYVNLYLVDDPLNNIEFSELKNEKSYLTVKGIFLTSKQIKYDN
ncbi:DUF5819 family protein [Flavobacterium sp. SORGH_AS_0622]|jgi:hypothetical protein|uniref:DUF5819 family protein n=1 Tax=Flavobacterium sp. SORGH_AS_0622 TaxID=3041772 RepID=UPI0027858F3C|nr:DUF5819 family protein [Flavobacterium sp. SORGH_AS_0622]MDQ1164408.1 hypothetical protein [Flavobacterium sp. SORGH_AS_0622]